MTDFEHPRNLALRISEMPLGDMQDAIAAALDAAEERGRKRAMDTRFCANCPGEVTDWNEDDDDDHSCTHCHEPTYETAMEAIGIAEERGFRAGVEKAAEVCDRRAARLRRMSDDPFTVQPSREPLTRMAEACEEDAIAIRALSAGPSSAGEAKDPNIEEVEG
jgi:hypothetical protein